MQIQEHIEIAQSFLEAAEREFTEGDHLQASEKLWGAASHAVMAAAQQHGWPYGSHRAMRRAVDMMAEEYNAPILVSEFIAAQHFHANFYHGFMEEEEFDADSPVVRDFVHRVIALLPNNGAEPA